MPYHEKSFPLFRMDSFDNVGTYTMKEPGMLDPHNPNYGDRHGGPIRAENINYEPYMTPTQKYGTMLANGFNGMHEAYGKDMHMPVTVRTMTALESLTNPNMLLFDMLAGYLGGVLSNMLEKKGASSLSWKAVEPIDFFGITMARAVVDVLYHNFISDTDKFGGSLKEAIGTSLVWYFIMRNMKPSMPVETLLVQMISTTLTRFSISRIVHLP